MSRAPLKSCTSCPGLRVGMNPRIPKGLAGLDVRGIMKKWIKILLGIVVLVVIVLVILQRILRFTPESASHNLRNDFSNEVYVSEDGHKEAVYDKNGLLVEDPINMGSYNYYPRREQPLRHFIYDVWPWIKWGNSEDDPTTVKERRKAFLLDFRYGASQAFKPGVSP